MNTTGQSQRDIVLSAMQRRPGDFWPRGSGHVLLGLPGSPREQKAYHEPGGGFSPSPGSFGVSVWVRDAGGALIATGDSIAMGDVSQAFAWDDAGLPPAIVTRTPFYECRWSVDMDETWHFSLTPASAAASVAIAIRSAGPAGGPVTSLWRDGDSLVVNHRWVVTVCPAGASARLADEERPGWQNGGPSADRIDSPDGWAAACIESDGRRPLSLIIRDTAPRFSGGLRYDGVRSALRMELPDPEFAASLDAQAAHLLMGYVGGQTCPGEPVNYPLAWERDGAYSVMAMARCGQVETAKQLAVYFAENDFFGGFGAEGDAPGSAINLLAGVAAIARDDEFTRRIRPHAERKAGYIYEMLSAAREIDKTWVGPICPHLAAETDIPTICRQARDGLVAGAMDRHYPVLYTTAMSYRGLRQAARLAAQLGETEVARKHDAAAERMRGAWLAHFGDADLANERTYMSSLWPTWIVPPDFTPFTAGLTARWEGEHGRGSYPRRPLWTYFTHAEAHQWLFLGRPDIVWETVRYFRANQCSAGLYSWWEGEGEENTFGLWPRIRGWVKPPHVTPHYWTASEALLLQLDMLAYVDESYDEPVLVVGAGVPQEWVGTPMSVSGLRTAAGTVDWRHDGKKLDVTVHAAGTTAVRAGASFGAGTQITVRYV